MAYQQLTEQQRQSLFSRINRHMSDQDRQEWNRFFTYIRAIALDLKFETQSGVLLEGRVRDLACRLKDEFNGIPLMEE
ncbi:MAG: hypothetical protein MI744_07240 [Pseudomonadales bacterium]|nr:hypothetical protein [Pseudomonadales bacterium]